MDTDFYLLQEREQKGRFFMNEANKMVTEEELNMDNIPAPVSEPDKEEIQFRSEDVDPDRILSDILKLDNDGHANCQILFSMERLHDIEEGMTLDNVPDENREWLDDLQVENAVLDIYSMDGEITCLNLIFDNDKDVFIREINDFMNKYRISQSQLMDAEVHNNDMIMLSVLLMPYETDYQAFLQFAFPFWYGRVIGVTGSGNVMTLMFHNDNIDAIQIDMTEDELNTVKADVMRDMESGTGGNMFA